MLLNSAASVRLLVILVFETSSAHAKQGINVITTSKTLPDRAACGFKKVEDRVIGGDEAGIGEFPWMVALEYKYKPNGEPAGIRCGGSLINHRYVLTAAHCIKHSQFQVNNVRLGEWNIFTDPDCWPDSIDCADCVEKVAVIKEIPHQFYSGTSGDNDIGLLKLARFVEYTDYIRPICLPTWILPSPEFGAKLTVVGWGATDGNISNVPLKVELPLLANRNCSSKRWREIDGNQLCAGGEPGKDTCQGDSGGPLMRLYEGTVNQQLRWYQEGVVAYGTIVCGTAGHPAVYTRVSRYMVWILRKINKD